ncbi:hypothetical protein [Peribacillus frigoritolerans]|uniref:hypothetical protein n=1 Tax=Peribacillus castrilensis TaxID=2897690 RepID=UPI003DA6A932
MLMVNKFATFFKFKNKDSQMQQARIPHEIVKYEVGSRVPQNQGVLDLAQKVIEENQQFINKINLRR